MAQILMPRQKKDGLDKLAQVLGIINTGFGIKTNFDKQTLINKQQEAEAALAPQREEQAGLKNQLLSAQVSTEKNRGGLAQKAREASLQQELAKEQRRPKIYSRER